MVTLFLILILGGFYENWRNTKKSKNIEKRHYWNDLQGKIRASGRFTLKGKGVSFMENNAGFHGAAPNDEEYKKAMEELS